MYLNHAQRSKWQIVPTRKVAASALQVPVTTSGDDYMPHSTSNTSQTSRKSMRCARPAALRRPNPCTSVRTHSAAGAHTVAAGMYSPAYIGEVHPRKDAQNFAPPRALAAPLMRRARAPMQACTAQR